MTARMPRVLTIAGMDSGGAAGVAADLKAFARCGAHGMAAVVALTAQNTVEVRDIHEVITYWPLRPGPGPCGGRTRRGLGQGNPPRDPARTADIR